VPVIPERMQRVRAKRGPMTGSDAKPESRDSGLAHFVRGAARRPSRRPTETSYIATLQRFTRGEFLRRLARSRSSNARSEYPCFCCEKLASFCQKGEFI
jgi:hypothetical protein